MDVRLEEVWSKFDRAKHHYDSWNATADEWLDRNPYGVRGRPEPGSDWFVVRFVEIEPPPFTQLALIFADFLHNLRAVLDHAVCHLVGASNTTDSTGFPVVRKPQDWGSALGSRLKDFPPGFTGIIKDAQPFNHPTDAESHWLYLLHHLDIRNKHVLLVKLRVSDFEWEPTFELNRVAKEGDGRMDQLPATQVELRDGEELVRIRMISEENDLRIVKLREVNNAHIGIGPHSDLLEDFPPNTPLPNFMGEVGTVLTALEPAFT